jgi:hypothetical protein
MAWSDNVYSRIVSNFVAAGVFRHSTTTVVLTIPQMFIDVGDYATVNPFRGPML